MQWCPSHWFPLVYGSDSRYGHPWSCFSLLCTACALLVTLCFGCVSVCSVQTTTTRCCAVVVVFFSLSLIVCPIVCGTVAPTSRRVLDAACRLSCIASDPPHSRINITQFPHLSPSALLWLASVWGSRR